MGRAEELFKRIQDNGAAEVHRMISAELVEELYLDYKRSSTTLPAAKLSDEDRKNLAKAIAGFANSEGGVIVWGVDCRQTAQGDVPTKPVLINQPVALKTLFDGALGGLTLPPHSNVENVPLLDASGAGGFLITYVPTGLHVPYQTLYPKQEYYIRAGSTFQPTPHGVLAGMFGRAPQPNVAPIVTFLSGQIVQNVPPAMRLTMPVSVVNQGRGLAEDIFFTVEAALPSGSSLNYTVHSGSERKWSTTRNGRTCFTITLGAQMILPPGAELLVFSINLEVDRSGKGDHAMTLSCGSRGGPGAAQRIVLTGDVVDGAFEHYTHQYPDHVGKREGDKSWEERIKECIRST